MKRLVGGAVFFVLGGTAAAGLSIAQQPNRAAAEAERKISEPLANVERIAVPAADVHRALAAGLIDHPIKTILNVPQRLTYGDFRWDERGVPEGPVWIRVDPKAQLLSVFRGGNEIGTAVILYGARDVPTPTGKFPILAKLKDHRSATYDNAPMPYTLRLTADGVSIHASDVRWGYATHGCIGVPKEFAAKLFAAASVGDEVFIVRS